MVRKILTFSNTACTERHACTLCIHHHISHAYPGTSISLLHAFRYFRL